MKTAWLGIVCLLVILLAACSNANIENTEAVRAAMVEYLDSRSGETGLDPETMDINVDAVAFERDVARATVSFLIKGTDQGMQLNYTLDREGDQWVVRGRQDETAVPHAFPSGDELPEAGPVTGPLPEGHPEVDPGSSK